MGSFGVMLIGQFTPVDQFRWEETSTCLYMLNDVPVNERVFTTCCHFRVISHIVHQEDVTSLTLYARDIYSAVDASVQSFNPRFISK